MRTISLSAMQAMFAAETAEAFVPLVTITHPSLTVPIRVVNYDVNLVSRGNTFVAYPFTLTLPDDLEASAPRARIVIDNVDQDIIRAIRNATGEAPEVNMEVIMVSAPDTVQCPFPGFRLASVRYDSLVIEGDLNLDVLIGASYPSGRFRPSAFPGLG